jgi:hypothetical protein
VAFDARASLTLFLEGAGRAGLFVAGLFDVTLALGFVAILIRQYSLALVSCRQPSPSTKGSVMTRADRVIEGVNSDLRLLQRERQRWPRSVSEHPLVRQRQADQYLGRRELHRFAYDVGVG